MSTIKLINWNIASLNAALTGDSLRAKQSYQVLQKLKKLSPDVVSLQETKLPPNGPNDKLLLKLQKLFSDYQFVYRNSQKPAKTSYSGTMMIYRKNLQPIIEKPVLEGPKFLDQEGRIITLEFSKFYLINSYIPHYEYHQVDLHHTWIQKLVAYFKQLDFKKPLVVAGDFAVLPIKQKTNFKEQSDFLKLLEIGLTDVFAQEKPTSDLCATWWPPNVKKQKDHGWRIDFWLLSNHWVKNVKDVQIIDTKERRDHAPIMLSLDY